MKDQRGFAEIILIGTLVGITVLFLVTGPLKGVFGGSSKKVKTERSSVVTEPVFVKDKKTGETYVLQKTSSTFSNFETNDQSRTLVQKLLALPKLWLLLMILGLFFPPIAGVMGFINSRLTLAAKQMVTGVERGLEKINPEEKDKVLNELSKKYDHSTKKLVSKLKNDH